MNELSFKFGQNSITYENGKRFITINGKKHNAGKYYYLNVLESFVNTPSLSKCQFAIKCSCGLRIYIMRRIPFIIQM